MFLKRTFRHARVSIFKTRVFAHLRLCNFGGQLRSKMYYRHEITLQKFFYVSVSFKDLWFAHALVTTERNLSCDFFVTDCTTMLQSPQKELHWIYIYIYLFFAQVVFGRGGGGDIKKSSGPCCNVVACFGSGSTTHGLVIFQGTCPLTYYEDNSWELFWSNLCARSLHERRAFFKESGVKFVIFTK